jgi:pseudouridine kinase
LVRREAAPPPVVVCVGGAAIDRSYRAVGALVPDSSNPVRGRAHHGGVARNVAESLARLGVATRLVSAVGADEAGRALLAALRARSVDTQHVAILPDAATATYVAVLESDGRLALGLSDMAILQALDASRIAACRAALEGAAWVFCDCNLNSAALAPLIDTAHAAGARIAVDAVSVAKAPHVAAHLARIDLLFLNRDEARALVSPPAPQPSDAESLARELRARGVAAVVMTCGDAGAVVADAQGTHRVAAVPAALRDATGAGDALTAATLAALARGAGLIEAVRDGTLAAALAIEKVGAVRADLTAALLDAARGRLP